jgi:hypothetical protein
VDRRQVACYGMRRVFADGDSPPSGVFVCDETLIAISNADAMPAVNRCFDMPVAVEKPCLSNQQVRIAGLGPDSGVERPSDSASSAS